MRSRISAGAGKASEEPGSEEKALPGKLGWDYHCHQQREQKEKDSRGGASCALWNCRAAELWGR